MFKVIILVLTLVSIIPVGCLPWCSDNPTRLFHITHLDAVLDDTQIKANLIFLNPYDNQTISCHGTTVKNSTEARVFGTCNTLETGPAGQIKSTFDFLMSRGSTFSDLKIQQTLNCKWVTERQ
jgi:hypothetical protein